MSLKRSLRHFALIKNTHFLWTSSASSVKYLKWSMSQGQTVSCGTFTPTSLYEKYRKIYTTCWTPILMWLPDPLTFQSLCIHPSVIIHHSEDWHAATFSLWFCVCVWGGGYLHIQSTFNGTSSEEALTMQLQVTLEGLLRVTWSDVLCGVSAEPMRKHLQDKRSWRKSNKETQSQY